MSFKENPPAWCKDAIPSPRGWRNPKTNELLISIKLDMDQFLEIKDPEPEVVEEKQEKKTRKSKSV